MKNCCGPFKRGRPAKAVVPSQQCFVDCCGNLCPPDGCCDEVKIHLNCGCGCDCTFKGHNFGALRFRSKRKQEKKKRRKRGEIPTFSKKALEENGFTFAAATIPTPPTSSPSSESSSSSSSSSSCECRPMVVILSTTACCLYVTADAIEAVGTGKVSAQVEAPNLANCQVSVSLNGAQNEVDVFDGDVIEVEVNSNEECPCCEVEQECVSQTTTMWVQKSGKDKKTIVMNKKELLSKINLAAQKVRGKKIRRNP